MLSAGIETRNRPTFRPRDREHRHAELACSLTGTRRPSAVSVVRLMRWEEFMRLARSSFILGTLLLAALPGSTAFAQDYPSRPVTLIAPWPPGGAVDTLCRIFGAKLTDRLGKTIVIENRPGAGSVVGVAAAARAAPDGHTLVM